MTETSSNPHCDRLRSDHSIHPPSVPVPAQHTNHPSRPYSFERWLEEARRITDEFNHNGPRGPTSWVLVRGHEIHRQALEAGREGDNVLYIARAYVEVRSVFIAVTSMKGRD